MNTLLSGVRDVGIDWLLLVMWIGGLAFGLSAVHKHIPTKIEIYTEYDDVEQLTALVFTARMEINRSKTSRPKLEPDHN